METNLISALFSEYICRKRANLGWVSYMTQKALHTIAKNSHGIKLFVYLLQNYENLTILIFLLLI